VYDVSYTTDMHIEPWRIITSLWILTGIVWAVGALTTKRTRRHESVASRILHISIMAVAFALVFKPAFRPGPLDMLFIVPTPAVEWTGVALTAAGIGLTIFARLTLGRNWSGTVTVKEDHELIRGGPYAVVRHPIYSGLALALLGSSISSARLGALLGVVVGLAGLRLKSRIEENFMEQEFGEQYTDYKCRVKALIPLVW
jgi:protein-S-isoprenylcysteine O-methyltransferase Ste14